MEISGAVLRRSSTGSVHHRLLFGRSDAGAPRRSSARVRVPVRAICGGAVFWDKGHLQYYDERREKQDKKRAKLIKTLKKDLSELYSMGVGVDNDQSDKITEVAKQLLDQLNQIKVEEKDMKKKEKEMKMKKKEEKKAACKMVCDEDSSSSSSESSESDCEEPRILQLSDLKATTATITVPNPVPPIPLHLSAPAPAPLPLPAPALALMQTVPVADVLPGKIEVCMGGKCKKSGSMDLLREFERKVGNEGGPLVVGCKCMGKCKEGPNIRVSSFDFSTTGTIGGGESVSVMRDQLCIGVGLDDVGIIVAHFFSEEEQDGAGNLIPA